MIPVAEDFGRDGRIREDLRLGRICLSRRLAVPVSTFEDIILARQRVKRLMVEMDFCTLARTRVITAVSELTRNIVVHAGSGEMTVFQSAPGSRLPLILCEFTDQGPGIADIFLALRAGYSTSDSMGLGLSGSRKLCKYFHIESTLGKGTRVIIAEWKTS